MERYLSLKDHVYNYISERINNGMLKAGDRIPEPQISEELNISRTPVREALMQLASDGYLDSMPRRGFRVKSLDVNKARQLYEVIGTLEGRAAAICADVITESALSRMEFLVESMEAAIKARLSETYYELQMEFHSTYLNLCPNKEMVSVLARLKNSFIRKYYLFEDPDNEFEILHETNQQHYEIIRLFRQKNPGELERFMRECHWDSAKARFDILPTE